MLSLRGRHLHISDVNWELLAKQGFAQELRFDDQFDELTTLTQQCGWKKKFGQVSLYIVTIVMASFH